jgi:hypothetical protein
VGSFGTIAVHTNTWDSAEKIEHGYVYDDVDRVRRGYPCIVLIHAVVEYHENSHSCCKKSWNAPNQWKTIVLLEDPLNVIQ